MTDKDIISIKNFKLSFGNKEIIRGLSFNVKKGEIFGFLGSNGSGKTTTIRALLGIYQADSGELLINGEEFSPERIGTIGYLPEERGLYKKEKVIDVMQYFGRLKGLSKKEAQEFSKKYLKRVGLEDKANSNIDKLSGGQQQKIQLGITIMGKPEILILDEPTCGLDYKECMVVMQAVEELREKGCAVLMVCHDMEVVSDFATRVIVMTQGSIIADGPLADVFAQDDIMRAAAVMPPQVTQVARVLSKHVDSAYTGLTKVSEIAKMTERIVRDAKNRSAAARFVEAATAEHAQKNRRQNQAVTDTFEEMPDDK